MIDLDVPIVLGQPFEYRITVTVEATTGHGYGDLIPFQGAAEAILRIGAVRRRVGARREPRRDSGRADLGVRVGLPLRTGAVVGSERCDGARGGAGASTAGVSAGRSRLDERLVALGLAESRTKAQALIMAGQVLVDDVPVDKAGTRVRDDAVVRLRGAASRYVSRGGDKLEGALADLGVDPAGKICLDVGASTGGFTDCLLQHGARARPCGGRRLRPARREAAQRPARGGDRAHQRARSRAVDDLRPDRPRGGGRRVHLAAARGSGARRRGIRRRSGCCS